MSELQFINLKIMAELEAQRQSERDDIRSKREKWLFYVTESIDKLIEIKKKISDVNIRYLLQIEIENLSKLHDEINYNL